MVAHFRIFALAALMALGMAWPAQSQDDAEARAFAKAAIEQLQAAMPDGTFEQEPGEPLQINVADTPRFEEGAINLHRIYGFCQTATEEDCQSQLTRLVAMLQEEAETSGPENLRIIVRDAEYWQNVTEVLDGEPLPQHRRIGDDLYAILAIDSPNAIAIAAPDTLAEFGLTAEEAWEQAARQTSEMLAELPTREALLEQPAAFVAEEYMASMLFDTEAWTIAAAMFGPDLAVAAPNEQVAVVAILADDALEPLREFARDQCASAARCISPNVYRFRDDKWVIAR